MRCGRSKHYPSAIRCAVAAVITTTMTRRSVLGVLCAVLVSSSVAHADYTSDRNAAVRLLRQKRKAEAQAAAAAEKVNRQPIKLSTPIGTSQTARVCSPGSNVCTTQSVNQVSGGPTTLPTPAIDVAARGDVGRYTAEASSVSQQLYEIAQRNPEALRDAEKQVEHEGDFLVAIFAWPLLIPIIPLVGVTMYPGIGQVSVTARILGAGNKPGVDGIQGDGLMLSYNQQRLLSRHTLGVMAAIRIEAGGYKEHGMIGSVGLDLGPGLRGRNKYLGTTIGAHWAASLYQGANWFPLQVHAGWLRGNWALAISGGIGWRKALANPPAEAMVSEGPWGTRSSTFRIGLLRRFVEVGFSVEDLDGNSIGSFNIGYGRRQFGMR